MVKVNIIRFYYFNFIQKSILYIDTQVFVEYKKNSGFKPNFFKIFYPV